MAKETKFELSSDGFDFDADLEIPDFGQASAAAGKKDYKKVSMSLGKSALSGALEGLTEEGFIRRTIRSALPSGYGTALDIADEASSTLRSLYNDSVKEIKPLINDLKRVTKRVQEPLDKYLPKTVSNVLKKFGDSIDQGRPGELDPEQQREAMLTANLAEVFKHTVVSQAKREQAEDARSKVREQIDQIRHKDSMGQLNEIRLSVARSAGYTQNVTSQFQRKSLELQYRSFFVLKDMYTEQRKMNMFQEEALRQITANTGAPDYMKMTEAVRLKKVIRNKFADMFEGGLVGDNRNFFRDLGKNFREVAGDRIRNAAYGASSGLQSVEQATEMLSMMQEINGLGMEGASPSEMAAKITGNMAAQHYGEKGVKWVKSKLPTTGKWGTARSHVARIGHQAAYQARTIPQQMRAWAEGFGGIPFVPDALADVAREAILRSSRGPDRNLRKDQLKNMSAPGVFSNQVAKSITEVIPGFLSRIYREIQILRTGDESTDLTRYNYQTNKFDTHSNVKAHVFNNLIGKNNSHWLRSDMDQLMKHVDPDGDKLSPAERKELEHQLLMDYAQNNAGRVERYTDPTNLRHVSGHTANKIADLFNERFASNKDMNLTEREIRAGRQDMFSNLAQSVGQQVKLARSTIQDLADAGMLDTLENLGLVDENGNIEIERIAEYHLNRAAAGPMNTPGGPGRTMRRASRRRGDNLGGGVAGRGPLGRGPGGGGRTTTVHNYHQAAADNVHREAQSQTQFSGDHLKSVIDAIKANNNLTVLEKVSATLTSIENEIKAGVVMYNAGDVSAATLGPDGKPFLDRSLRDHWRMGKEGTRSGLNRAWNWWKQPGFFSEHWGRRGEHFDTAKKKVQGAIKWGRDKIDDMTEVYIKGELQPRLTAWGMKAGMYYGKTEDGKLYVIKKWKDIKGAVFDENGNVIMTPQEAMQAFARTTVGLKAIQVADWVKRQAKAGWEAAKSTGGLIGNTIAEAVKKGSEWLDAQDVYVKSDMKTPKLLATLMRSKGYRSMHRRDKFIMNPSEIDGPVVDLSGNQVLTDNDIREGLVDKHGRELKTGKLRLLQVGADTFNWGVQKVKNAWNMTKDFLSGKWQGFQNWFKIDGIAFSGGKTIIERLTEIRDLLQDRLPARKKHVIGDIDGDGIREGSYEDQKKKGEIGEDKGASAADAAKNMAKKFGEKGTSLYGLLGGGALDLMKAWKNRKKKGAAGGEEKEGGESTLDKASTIADIASDVAAFIPGGGLIKGAGKGIWKGGKWGLKKLGAGLKGAAGMRKAAAAGEAGLVSAEEAAKAAEGIAAHGGEAAGIGEEALKVAQAAKAVGGTSKLMSVLGALKTALGIGVKGAGAAVGAWKAGNVATAKMAGSALRTGAKYGAKGLVGGLGLAAKGLYKGAKWGIPALGKNIAGSALKLGKMGSGLGLGIGLDLAAHAANASGHTTLGTGLDYAGDAVTGYGLAGTAAGIMGIEGGALGLLGTVIGTALSPIGLAAIGIGAVGYGAYKAYKWSQTKNLTDLSALRVVQYGFPADDSDHAKILFALEDMLEPNVSFVNGAPRLTNKGLKEEDLLGPFGVDKNNKEQLTNWIHWFQVRFRPVFLVNMAAMYKEDKTLKGLKKIEGLKPEQKKSFVDHARWPNGPYKSTVSPFTDGKPLTMFDADVASYAQKLMAKIDVEIKKNPTPKKPGDDGKKNVAQIVGAATGAQLAGHMGEKAKQPGWQDVKGLDKTGKMDVNVATTGATVTVAGKFDPAHMTTGATLDGLTCIRFKTYGLRDMNIEKVQMLLRLEMETQKNVKVNDKFVASWSGNLQKIFSEQAPPFGIKGAHTTDGYNWIAWFNLRFLPTYLAYVTALSTATKKDDPQAAILTLKPQDALTVASAIKTATGQNGSVWNINQMPWPGYEGNSDVKSTDVNYAAMQDKAQQTKFKETKGVPGSGNKSSDKKTAADKGGSPPSLLSKAGDWIAKKWDGLTHDDKGNLNTFGKVANTVGTVAKHVVDANVALGKAAYNTVANSTIGQTLGKVGGAVGAAGAKVGKVVSASAAKIKAALLSALKAAGITSPNEVAMFMGQTDVESGGFKSLSENLNYKPDRLYSVFGRKHFSSVADAAAVAQGGPEAIADRVYGNRMGNSQPGDGYKYRGRGVIQLTGKDNYAHFGKLIGVDLVNNPDLAADPDVAAKLAIAFWKEKGAGAPAQQGNVQAVTQLINGGQNAEAARASKYKEYLAQAQQGSLTAGGQTLTTADSGQKGGAGAGGGTSGVGGVAAGSSASGGPAASKGTGAPSGFGGSSPSAGGAGGPTPPTTVFSAMAGQKAAGPSSSQANLSQAPSSPAASGPTDPFSAPSMGPAAAMGTGFSPNAARSATDLSGSRSAQAAASASTAVPGGDVGMRQLKVQQDMLVALQTIAKAVGSGAPLGGQGSTAGGANNPSSMQQTVAAGKMASQQSRPMKSNLLSVAKPSFADS